MTVRPEVPADEDAVRTVVRAAVVEARPLGFTRPSPRIPERAFQAWLTPAHRPGLSGALVCPDVFSRTTAPACAPDAHPATAPP